jgi:hypothetical protein
VRAPNTIPSTTCTVYNQIDILIHLCSADPVHPLLPTIIACAHTHTHQYLPRISRFVNTFAHNTHTSALYRCSRRRDYVPPRYTASQFKGHIAGSPSLVMMMRVYSHLTNWPNATESPANNNRHSCIKKTREYTRVARI